MPKQTEQKACLSTFSAPPRTAPPFIPDTPGPEPPPKDTPLAPVMRKRGLVTVDGSGGQQGPRRPEKRPDYFTTLAYILIYFEVGWLILILLRTYSRN